MKRLLSTVTSVSDLYKNFLSGGEEGFFSFVRGEQKFYEWKDEQWKEVVFTDTLIVTSWIQVFENGIYNVTNNSSDTPIELTGALKLIVFTDYVGKQVKVVQSESEAYYLMSGEVFLLWGTDVPVEIPVIKTQKYSYSKYEQTPVEVIDDLYINFPDGGSFGFYAFVDEIKNFAYWDVQEKAWLPVSGSNAQELINNLNLGDIITHDVSEFAPIAEITKWEQSPNIPAATTLHPRWNDSGDLTIFGTDRFGFGVLPSGFRQGSDGVYYTLGTNILFANSNYNLTQCGQISLQNDYSYVSSFMGNKHDGMSTKLVRPLLSGENLISDGTIIPNAFIDNDANSYNGIKIGTQVWTTTNLKVTKYADGTTIPTNLSDVAWVADTVGACAVYGKNDGAFVPSDELTTEALMVAAYGRLYNWYAVNNAHGLIDPTDGWHVPSDAEFTTLTDYLCTIPGITVDNVGDVLKSTRQVNSPYTIPDTNHIQPKEKNGQPVRIHASIIDELPIINPDTVIDANYVHTDNNFTTTLLNKINSITEIFTTALKIAYDNSVAWILTNGTNLLNHLTNTSNPHSTTALQVGAPSGSGNSTNINTGDETAARIATIAHGAVEKTTLIDGDEVAGTNSANSFSLIRTTWLNVWTNYIKPKTDALYATLTSLAALQTQVNGLAGGSYGSIAYNASAPTPTQTIGTAVNYTFSSGGVTGAWLGSITVVTGDMVAVLRTGTSTYTYTYISMSNITTAIASYYDSTDSALKINGGYIASDGTVTIASSAYEYAIVKCSPLDHFGYLGKSAGTAATGVVAIMADGTTSILVDGDYLTTPFNFQAPANCYELRCSSVLSTMPLSILKIEFKQNYLQHQFIDLTSANTNKLRNNELLTIHESVNADDGKFTSSANWIRSELTRAFEGEVFIYTGVANGYNAITFFDINKKRISSGTVTTGTSVEVIIPSGVSYVLACARSLTGDAFSFKYKRDAISITSGTNVYDVTMQQIASFVGQPFVGSTLGYEVHRPKTIDTPVRYYVIPNGNPASIKTKHEWFATDYKSDSINYSAINLLVYSDTVHFGVNRAGTGVRLIQIIGGSYSGSALETASARIEFGIDDKPIMHGRKWTVNEILNIKPSIMPTVPSEGDIYYDSALHKLRCYDGTAWNNLF